MHSTQRRKSVSVVTILKSVGRRRAHDRRHQRTRDIGVGVGVGVVLSPGGAPRRPSVGSPSPARRAAASASRAPPPTCDTWRRPGGRPGKRLRRPWLRLWRLWRRRTWCRACCSRRRRTSRRAARCTVACCGTYVGPTAISTCSGRPCRAR